MTTPDEHPPIPDEARRVGWDELVLALGQGAEITQAYARALKSVAESLWREWTRDMAVVALPEPDTEDADDAFWHINGHVVGLVLHADSPMVEVTAQDADDPNELMITPAVMALICRAGLAACARAEQLAQAPPKPPDAGL